ncbi:F-box/LRR-repeat protein At3g03360 [Linum perenne]
MKRSYLDGGGSRGDDRISELPDEIIHDILDRLRSPETAAKSTSLSRRWMHIWRSYPILEFDYHPSEYYHSSEKLQSFVAAVSRKFSSSQLIRIKAVRVYSECHDFMGVVLNLIVNREPEEIVLKGDSNKRYQLLPAQLNNNSNLRILYVYACNFWEFPADNHLDIMTSNLRVLSLHTLNIDEQLVNAMIAGAPLLEELSLSFLYPKIKRLYICNNPNLKILEICHCHGQEFIQISETKSLEVLSIDQSLISSDADISPLQFPSLKSLDIRAYQLSDDFINNVIANSPSLESLRIYYIRKADELEIRSQTLQKLTLNCSGTHVPQMRLHIDAPRLKDVCYYSGDEHPLPAIIHPANLQEAQLCIFRVSLGYNCGLTMDCFIELRDCLAKLRQQFQSVQLSFGYFYPAYEAVFDLEQVEDGSPVPMIEHVEFQIDDLSSFHAKYILMDVLFWSCRPKYLCVKHGEKSHWLMAKFFIDNRNSVDGCKSGCKCWRHQLKDVKIVKRKKGGSDEQLSEISNYLDWPCTEYKRDWLRNWFRVWFKLIWH